nr:WhiB family transcriptional regulator [Mycobacteroides abscessus]
MAASQADWAHATAATGRFAWRAEALCRAVDPELFFHPEGERGVARRVRQQRARRVCAACPVMETCRQFAINSRQLHGIWGGLSETERGRAIGRGDRTVGNTKIVNAHRE